jgi:AraC-like DNA-binding protein
LIGKRLTQRMELECIYQDANLTLTDLAGKIGTSPQLLSQYLNEVLGMSFFEYINAARVRAVQALIRDSAYQHLTVLDLAFKAGFNSKSAFNTSFKRVSGITPSQWRKQGTAMGVPIGQDELNGATRQTEAVVP